jgi:GH24 family phage-related lysozyme (muramidase)
MQISHEGISLIKKFEGCKLQAYYDAINVPTIAYGRTKGVTIGDTCTQEQADKWLEEERDHQVPHRIRQNAYHGRSCEGFDGEEDGHPVQR